MSALPADTPYASHAQRYITAGWHGVLPLPARKKKSPPDGYTGRTGSYPEPIQISEWIAHRANGNIGLRMNEDIIGIDVDQYDGKAGGDTFANLIDELGPLPDTWTSTSRYDGISGIRFYRLPRPIELIGSLPGIEFIQRHHRYAVVAPSIHPDSGDPYRWLGPGGEVSEDIPNVDDLPMLPDAWVAHLEKSNKTTRQRQAMSTGIEVAEAVDKAYGAAMRGLRQGTRHDSALAGATTLTRLAALDYPGADDTLNQLRNDFLAAVGDSRSNQEAESEWDRIIDSAEELVASSPSIAPRWEQRSGGTNSDDYFSDELKAKARTAPAEPWEEPRGIPAPPPPVPFPLDSLPAWAQEHAVTAADKLQVPVDLTATLAIGALSAACTGRARVHAADGWIEPVNLYLVIAMRSGAGKSPAADQMAKWLHVWQKARVDAVRDDWDRASLILRHARKAMSKAEGGGGDINTMLDHLATVKAAEEEMPEMPRLIIDDATPEAVATLLQAHNQRLAVISTEADLFDMLTKGKPGQRANMNIYLKAWSGDPFTRDRKGGTETGSEWTELDNPLLTVSVTVQPSVLGRIQADGEMTSRGFTSRFMASMPPDFIGGRDQTRRFRGGGIATRTAYDDACAALASRWATWARPADIHLDAASVDIIEAFLVEIEPDLAIDARYEHLSEWANKLHASILRYAGLLHLAEGRDSAAPIEVDTMSRAVELGRYWLDHAHATMALAGEVETDRAMGLLEWIAGQGVGQITLAAMQAGYRRPGVGLNKVADYIAPVEILIDLGWLRPVDNSDWRAQVGVKRSKSPYFALWPEIIGKPQTVNKPRTPRTASMGERENSSSLPTDHQSPHARGTRLARIDGDEISSGNQLQADDDDDDDLGSVF